LANRLKKAVQKYFELSLRGSPKNERKQSNDHFKHNGHSNHSKKIATPLPYDFGRPR
jgi:hypothetical protein